MSRKGYGIPVLIGADNSRTHEIIENAKTYASQAMTSLQQYLNTMRDMATQNIDVPFPPMISEGIDFSRAKELLDELIGLKPPMPTLDPIDTTPVPDTPVIDLPDQKRVSELLDAISEQLLSDINEGGYGLDPEEEALLWERSKDRELLEYHAAVDEIDEHYAASGFSKPPGALQKLADIARQKFLNKLSSLNREQTVERLKMYVECRKFAIQAGVSLRQMVGEIIKTIVDKYTLEIKAFEERLNAIKTKNLLKVEGHKAELESYATEGKVLSSAFELDMAAREKEYRAQINALQANIEIAKNLLLQIIKQAELRMEGAKSAADVYKAIAASALSTIHASANLSAAYSSNFSYNKGEMDSDSYSYAENFNHSGQI